MGAWIAAASALWLGVLTSISPCPLATNIAAMTYLSRQMTATRTVRMLVVVLGYVLGRSAVYVGLGMLLVGGVMAAPGLSFFLQKYINMVLGPVLILAGMSLLELVSWPEADGRWVASLRDRFQRDGVGGAILLGMIFAFAFCPVSAALFFGSLIPLAIAARSSALMPAIYGLGTALPVIGFAFLVVLGGSVVSRVFGEMTRLEWWGRRSTGVVFVVVGMFMTLRYVFQLV